MLIAQICVCLVGTVWTESPLSRYYADVCLEGSVKTDFAGS